MEIKLKSVIQEPRFILTLKALALAGVYYLTAQGNLQGGSLVILLIAGVLLYAIPKAGAAHTAVAFIAFLFLIAHTSMLLGERMGTITNLQNGISALVIGALFYILLSVRGGARMNAARWYHVFYYSLIYLLLIDFYLGARADAFFLQAFLVFIITLFLFEELLRRVMEGKRAKTIMRYGAASVFAWGFIQLAWVVSLLPLEVINSANLMLVLAFVVGEVLIEGLENRLTPRRTLMKVTTGIVLILIIFITSKWGI